MPALSSGAEGAGQVDSRATIEQLQQGLVSRTVIGQAQGILMERFTVGADEAFRMLVSASQHSNRKLSAAAADLVATGDWPTAYDHS